MLDATALDPEPIQQDAHGALLDELIGIGAALVRQLAAEPPTPETVASYDTLTRSIRRSVLLAKHLREEKGVREPTAARKQVLRSVEDAIQREWHGNTAERLHRELLERLDSPDTREEIATRPVEAVIQDITRDMGLGLFGDTCHPWMRRTPHDIATLRARALGLPLPPPDPDPDRWHIHDPPEPVVESDEAMVARLLGTRLPP